MVVFGPEAGQLGDRLEDATLALVAHQRPGDRRRPQGGGHPGGGDEPAWLVALLLTRGAQIEAIAECRRGRLQKVGADDPYFEQPALADASGHRELGDHRRHPGAG